MVQKNTYGQTYIRAKSKYSICLHVFGLLLTGQLYNSSGLSNRCFVQNCRQQLINAKSKPTFTGILNGPEQNIDKQLVFASNTTHTRSQRCLHEVWMTIPSR